MIARELEEKALGLKPTEKIHLIDLLLDSLTEADQSVLADWVEESEKRYAAYQRGEIAAIPLATLKKKYSGT
ncbi:MAG TPA: addiction module protein [Candidatus Hydrogenedentes bacterium]|nr:addiction module protein [Candidatus Hydrogenedentota bacterium]